MTSAVRETTIAKELKEHAGKIVVGRWNYFLQENHLAVKVNRR